LQQTISSVEHTHTRTQPFNGLLSRPTRVYWYQKKHSPTHTHPDHRTSFIIFLHLLRSTASSLFKFTCLTVLLHNISLGSHWSPSLLKMTLNQSQQHCHLTSVVPVSARHNRKVGWFMAQLHFQHIYNNNNNNNDRLTAFDPGQPG